MEMVPEMVGIAVESEGVGVDRLFLRAMIPPVMPNPRRAPRIVASKSSLNMV